MENDKERQMQKQHEHCRAKKKKQELHLDLTKLIIEWFICLVWQQVIQPHLMQWDASQAGKHALQWWNNVPQFQTAQQVCQNC